MNEKIANNDKGFTLIELLVSLSIFSILISVIMSSFVSNMRRNMDAQIRYEAIQAAQKVLDDYRFQEITTLTAPTSAIPVTIGTRDFSVAVTFCETTAFCPSNEIRHISVDVSYKDNIVYETDTIFSEF